MHCSSMYVKTWDDRHVGSKQRTSLPDFRALDEARCVGQAEAGREKALFAFREAGGERLLGR